MWEKCSQNQPVLRQCRQGRPLRCSSAMLRRGSSIQSSRRSAVKGKATPPFPYSPHEALALLAIGLCALLPCDTMPGCSVLRSHPEAKTLLSSFLIPVSHRHKPEDFGAGKKLCNMDLRMDSLLEAFHSAFHSEFTFVSCAQGCGSRCCGRRESNRRPGRGGGGGQGGGA